MAVTKFTPGAQATKTAESTSSGVGGGVQDSLDGTSASTAPSVRAINEALASVTAGGVSTGTKGDISVVSANDWRLTTAAKNALPISTATQGALDAKAPLASPALTGTPTTPTAAPGTNSTQIASTAFVAAALAALLGSTPAALDTLDELAQALGDDPNFATTVINGLAGKAAVVHAHDFSEINGLAEFVRDTMANALQQGANVTITHDDAADTITIAATGGGGGGSLSDGTYGDIDISGGATVFTIRNAAVALTNIENVANGTVLARTTAGAGSPEAITFAALKTALGLDNVNNTSDSGKPISTATQTALDGKSNTGHSHTASNISDFNTVVDGRISAASATGTGSIVRATSPTLSAPTMTGLVTAAGAEVAPATAISGNTINVTAKNNTGSIAADTTFTFSGAPANAQTWFGAFLTNTDTNPHRITVPSSYSMADQVAKTTFVIPASGRLWLMWRWDGSSYCLFGEPPYLDRWDSASAPTANDDENDGYGPGSQWMTTAGALYICETATAGAAVWNLIGGGGAATNLSATRDATSMTVASDTGSDATLAAATTSLAGVMSAADKTKLDAIEAGATADMTGAEIVAAIDTQLGGTTWQSGGGAGATNLSATRDATTMTVASDTGSDATLAAATSSLAGVMTAADKTKLDAVDSLSIPATTNTYQGRVITGINAGEALSQWDTVYIGAGGTWLRADANGSNTFPARGVVVAATASGAAATVLVFGVVRNNAWTFTPNGDLYLSGTVGGLTQTVPSTTGDRIQKIGYALTATSIFVCPGTGEMMTAA